MKPFSGKPFRAFYKIYEVKWIEPEILTGSVGSIYITISLYTGKTMNVQGTLLGCAQENIECTDCIVWLCTGKYWMYRLHCLALHSETLNVQVALFGCAQGSIDLQVALSGCAQGNIEHAGCIVWLCTGKHWMYRLHCLAVHRKALNVHVALTSCAQWKI